MDFDLNGGLKIQLLKAIHVMYYSRSTSVLGLALERSKLIYVWLLALIYTMLTDSCNLASPMLNHDLSSPASCGISTLN